MSSKIVCVIFDIGKTNKKMVVLDQSFGVVHESRFEAEEVSDQDGYHADDLQSLVIWIKNSLRNLIRSGWEVKAVNFAASGGSIVHLDAAGRVVTPLYSYLKTIPYDLKKQFLETYDATGQFTTETASTLNGFLNTGLQLYWLKYAKPDIYKKVDKSVFMPQYLQSIFTKKIFIETSSLGCHSSLWNFSENAYHQWVKEESLSVIDLEIVALNATEVVEFEGQKIHIGAGINSVAASLIPFQKLGLSRSILLSTGTDNVSLNPENTDALSQKELEQDAFLLLDAQGKTVRATRNFAGNEHERQIRHLAEYFDKPTDFYKSVKFDREIVRNLRSRLKQANLFEIELGCLADSPFVERNLNQFDSYEVAYHQFMLDLIAQQMASLRLVFGRTAPKTIYVEGGFAENEIFMNLLTEACTGLKIEGAKYDNATAVGAAMMMEEFFL
jgi:L-fuculokinase